MYSKEYKHNEELLEYLKNKNVIIDDGNTYFENVHFNEIYSLYNFDKNIRAIFLKYVLEFELKIRGVMRNVIAKNYGIIDYLNKINFDRLANEEDISDIMIKRR